MSGYTPLFSSLTRGSLYGKWPDIGLWPIVLSLSDKNGLVDIHHRMLAGITGLPEDEVRACMERFCAPDPSSRSEEAGGARLVLVDEHRDWGWRIVNHGYYREKARLAAKNAREVESGREAERKAYARQQAKERPPVSAGDRRRPPASDPSNANANADVRALRSSSSGDLSPSSSERGKSDGLKTRSKSRKTDLEEAVRKVAAEKRLAQ